MRSELASLLLSAAILPSSAGQTRSTTDVIRTTTHLVEVNVIVQDKNGLPVTGLKKENFTILDQGKPQQIAFFSATTPTRGTPHSLAPNVFTNRYDLEGYDPGATIVILFDALNTSFEDQVYARRHILRFLETVKPQDHVAIFALSDHLIPLHDFSRDSTALANSVARFSPRLLAAFDASHPSEFSVPALAGDPFWKAFEDRVNNANGEIADSQILNRYRATYDAIVAIADYVTNIPGHKNLVWVSDGFPIQIGSERIGVPDRDRVRFDEPDLPGKAGSSNLTGLARVLNRADMAIYPIDAGGVSLDSTSGAFIMRQDQRESSRLLADRTGGKAFYGSNDIAGAINSAFEDDRYTYTLGFYPKHGTWDGKFREIKITLPIAGAHLRYRRGYFATPERSETEASMKQDLQDAARSPLDATALGIAVTTKAIPPASARMLQLQILLDPKQFLLHDQDKHRVGALDLLFLQKDGSGNFLAAEKQHFGIDFKNKEYDALSKSGLILQRRVAISTTSVQLRVVVRDADSGALGSVSIPVSRVF
jgi:VWFA-related protein